MSAEREPTGMSWRERMARYGSEEAARAYRRKFRRSLLRRLSDRREQALVHRLLRRAGPATSILDCPCGVGRLAPVLSRTGARVFSMDLSAEMVRGAAAATPAGRHAVADIHALPLRARSVEVVVCCRLLHHFPDSTQRIRILEEAARVASKAVLVSFSDAGTWRGRRSRTRRRPIPREQLRREAESAGLVLEEPLLRVGGLFSFVALALLRTAPSGPRGTYETEGRRTAYEER